ncbi:MAG: helix-turn-helix transcriptional regulator [Lachnospiraceae bacterium]|nr:helix-turn-helix transcriptional regulator [Lachnospiraceae bacterium]
MIYGLPERLKTLRMQRGYSQRKAAGMIGVASSVMSAYESGDKTPSIEKLLVISSLYHVSVDYLLGVDKLDTHRMIDVSHLTDEQINALHTIIESMK